MNEDQNINVNENEEVETVDTPSVEDLMAEIEELKRQNKAKDKKITDYNFEKKKNLRELNETDRLRAELEEIKAEREREKAEIARERALKEGMNTLSDNKINPKFANYLPLTGDSVEDNKTIKGFVKLFNEAIKNDRESNLKGSNPKSTIGLSGEITKETFSKMSIIEQSQLYNNNPELYKQLTQR